MTGDENLLSNKPFSPHFYFFIYFFFACPYYFLFLTILWQKTRASAPLDALHLGICSFQHNEGVLGLTHG